MSAMFLTFSYLLAIASRSLMCVNWAKCSANNMTLETDPEKVFNEKTMNSCMKGVAYSIGTGQKK